MQITEFQRVFFHYAHTAYCVRHTRIVYPAQRVENKCALHAIQIQTHTHILFCTSIPCMLWFFKCRRENEDKQHWYQYSSSLFLCIGIANGSSPAVDFPYCGCTYGFSSSLSLSLRVWVRTFSKTNRQKRRTHCATVFVYYCYCHNRISCADMLYFITFFLSSLSSNVLFFSSSLSH